jgi:ferric-dicitrate binding protein FerR (iron transport regulator)
MLSPGQQARLTPDGIALQKNVDLSQVMAWKEGFFQFDNTDTKTLMRQVARWYDVDVDFQGKIAEEGFSGKISRNVPLSKFLKVLELNDVHIKTEGRKITVMP